MRYASPSASEGFGHQFIPRVGDEVLIEFLHGDIDRPMPWRSSTTAAGPPPRSAARVVCRAIARSRASSRASTTAVVPMNCCSTTPRSTACAPGQHPPGQ
uniref:phage baseplate assembly protein V n=1 Tax=Xanthomonas oryzae TaxID=347 RepID=UPI003DA0344D